MGTAPDNNENEMMPLTRLETYLAKIAGEDITTPEVRTRLEAYLAKIAEEDVEVPEPRTRIEYYLNKIAENGGGDEATYTLASVEITNNTGNDISLFLPHVVSVGGGIDFVSGDADLGANWTDAPFAVPILSLKEMENYTTCKLPKGTSYSVSTTGNIEYSSSFNGCRITGDGTITISSPK